MEGYRAGDRIELSSGEGRRVTEDGPGIIRIETIPQELDRQSDKIAELRKMIAMLEDYLQPLMVSDDRLENGEKDGSDRVHKSPILVQLETNNEQIAYATQAIHTISQRVQL